MKDILKLESSDNTLNNVFNEYPFYIDIKQLQFWDVILLLNKIFVLKKINLQFKEICIGIELQKLSKSFENMRENVVNTGTGALLTKLSKHFF